MAVSNEGPVAEQAEQLARDFLEEGLLSEEVERKVIGYLTDDDPMQALEIILEQRKK